MKTEIGVMGGTFNPIHTRQLMIAQCAQEQFALKKVVFVPNGEPPHKKTDLLDRHLRYEMVAAAVEDNPLFEASRIEIDRPGVTWTIDTLKQLRQEYGDDVRLNFIIGEDNIKSLAGYDRRAEFLQLCRLLVSPRESAHEGLLDQWRQTLPEAQIELIDCPADARSSTLIRKWIRAGKSVRYLVPPAVLALLTSKRHYLETAAAEPQKNADAATPESAALVEPKSAAAVKPESAALVEPESADAVRPKSATAVKSADAQPAILKTKAPDESAA